MAINFADLDELDRQYDITVAVAHIYSYTKQVMEQSEKVRLNGASYFEYIYGKEPLQNLVGR